MLSLRMEDRHTICARGPFTCPAAPPDKPVSAAGPYRLGGLVIAAQDKQQEDDRVDVEPCKQELEEDHGLNLG